jgi:hypothetical protein
MFMMRKGQLFRCQNPECRAEIEVLKDSIAGETNPRCCCGASMKKPYTKPVIRELDKGTPGVADLLIRR